MVLGIKSSVINCVSDPIFLLRAQSSDHHAFTAAARSLDTLRRPIFSAADAEPWKRNQPLCVRSFVDEVLGGSSGSRSDSLRRASEMQPRASQASPVRAQPRQQQRQVAPNQVAYLVEAAKFRLDWARRNGKVERWRQWQEAVYILETKFKKKTVTATDMAKWTGARKLKADQPRFVDAVHKELSEVFAGTMPAQDTNKYPPHSGNSSAPEPTPIGAMGYRSATSALLMAGLPHSQEMPTTKESLQSGARPFSDCGFRPTRENMYDGWESMNELVRRGLFIRKKLHCTYVTTGVGQPDAFWLSELGQKWAEHARRQHEESSGNRVNFQPPASMDAANLPRVGLGRDANAARYLATVGPDRIQKTQTFEDGLIVLRATCPSENKKRTVYNVIAKLQGSERVLVSGRCDCKDGQKTSACKHVLALVELSRQSDAQPASHFLSSSPASSSSSVIPSAQQSEEMRQARLKRFEQQQTPIRSPRKRPAPLSQASCSGSATETDVAVGVSQQAASPCSGKKAAIFKAGLLQSPSAGTSVSIDLSESSSSSSDSRSVSQPSDNDNLYDEPEQGSLVKLRDSVGGHDAIGVVLGMEGSHMQVQILSNGYTMPVSPTKVDVLAMQDEIACWMIELQKVDVNVVIARIALVRLEVLPITTEVIKLTGVGKAVGIAAKRFSKQGSLAELAALAEQLRDRWRSTFREQQPEKKTCGGSDKIEAVIVPCDVGQLSVPIDLDTDSLENGVGQLNGSASCSNVALLFDNRERGRMSHYMGTFTAAEGRVQGNVVQASLKMADYLWVDLGSGADQGKLHNVAVERKTIGNLLGDSGRGHQLTQTRLLRRAGLRTLLLLEGSQWKARETVLQVDGANITCEKELHAYMVNEALANVFFLESPDQAYTAIALAAISQMLASFPRGAHVAAPEIPWAAAVPKTRAAEVAAKLYPDAAEQQPACKSLTDLAKECSAELDTGLEAVEVSMADAADFASKEELMSAIIFFSDSPPVFSIRFGLSLAVARSLLLLSSSAESPQKRARVENTGTQIHEGASGLRVGHEHGASFDITIDSIHADSFLEVIACTPPTTSLAERAREAAARIIRQASRVNKPMGRWDVSFLVVQQLSYKLGQATKSGDQRLGNDPRLYAAMVHVVLLLRGVHIKMARTAVDAKDFISEVQAVVKGRYTSHERQPAPGNELQID